MSAAKAQVQLAQNRARLAAAKKRDGEAVIGARGLDTAREYGQVRLFTARVTVFRSTVWRVPHPRTLPRTPLPPIRCGVAMKRCHVALTRVDIAVAACGCAQPLTSLRFVSATPDRTQEDQEPHR